MISIDPEKMKVARRLNGTVINGYAGYYEKITGDEGEFFIVAIPLNSSTVTELMSKIESEE